MQSPGWADLHGWRLDRSGDVPLVRQIYGQVRAAVLSGVLPAGTKLPSSRAMATRLGVARTSVVAAYEQLLTEGYAEGRHGSGTFVATDLTELSVRRHATRPIKPRATPAPARRHSRSTRSRQSSR